MATEISSYTSLVNSSEVLTPDEKAALLDTSKVQNPQGLEAWANNIQQTLIEKAAEAKIKKELDTRWESHKTEMEANNQNRRNGLSRSGTPTGPVPDMADGKSHDFLQAFR
jgi:hypothetical protein